MFVKSRTFGKALVTQMTFVRFFARVRKKVSVETATLREPLVTHSTFVRFFPSVCKHVRLYVTKFNKLLVAKVTRMWPVMHVYTYMTGETATFRK